MIQSQYQEDRVNNMNISNEHKQKIAKATKAMKELSTIFNGAEKRRLDLKERMDGVKFKREINLINEGILL